MALHDNPDLALPKGSLILVTGASGYIASNIIFEALEAGYRVRGTTRSAGKATTDVFQSSEYEAVIVAHMDKEGAFDDAVKGVHAIIHVASPTQWTSDPEEVVKPAVNSVNSIMASAMKEPTVRSFVYTSSQAAATKSKPNQEFVVNRDSWNTDVEVYTTEKGDPALVYSASKLQAERAVWDFAKKYNPNFVVNTVVPNFNIGRVIGKGTNSSNIILDVFRGNARFMATFPPQYVINVVEDARIHLAAAIDRTVVNERIFAFAYPYNWNDVLDVYRELWPDKEFMQNNPELGRDMSRPDNALGLKLLRKWYGTESYTDLKESIKQQFKSIGEL
ncbi:hypothetical protein F5B22DRAFT_646715 [Xylaria bambusicola]|uniref:uncharacterized protein n=1 Tax=Xylaria bambusicola TaxID=326684 RepID=UPI002008A1BA|nr:uncharacterized protein F5B22DRAFT_646715 [Xylaria bambusicola]KAI0515441.1 hypothetical protein F5B22DRAFT_646715 [Xylaria bambusicola]